MLRFLMSVIGVAFAATACADHAPMQRGARLIDYQHALPLVWRTLYSDGGETLYCGRRFGKDKGRAINVEHVFPMSWVARHLKCGQRQQCRDTNARFNLIEADLHNLWPARADVNKARSSHPFGMIDGERRAFEGCDFEVDERRRMVEPRPQARGEIARSVFYMAEEYGLAIYPRQGRLLQTWSRDDPVSNEERRRNNLIERIQGNRNKYIDTPELAEAWRF